MLNGASPQEAKAIELQTYARESGGTIEAVSQSADATRYGSFAYDSDDGFWLSNGSDRALIGYGASMNDVSNFLGNSGARDLGMQYASSRLVAKQASDAAFARGVVRGEAMYAAGVRNREQIGVDFSGFNRNVDAYVRFREGQRAQFNDFYSGLNGVQRFAFNAGANLFGGLMNGGKAIGNLTAFTGIQGRQAFADSWGGLGNSVAGAASYAYNNPAGFAKSAIVDPIAGAWDHYSGIYQADGFGAAAGTLTGNLLSGVPFALLGAGSARFGVGERVALNKANNLVGAATREQSWFDSVALNATRNPDSNRLVLGHFAREGVSYQKVAAHYEASYFKVDDWNSVTKGLSNNEIWRINEAFLDLSTAIQF